MNRREQTLTNLLRAVAEADVPGPSVDLWERVHSAGSASAAVRAVRARHRLVVLTILVLLLAAATPPAQAVARTLWHQLGLIFASDEAEPGDEGAIRVVLEPTLIVNPSLILSIEDIQEQVPFQVRVPSWLPEGVQFRGGTVSMTDAGSSATLSFGPTSPGLEPDPPRLHLDIGPVAPYLVPSSQQVIVDLNGVRAVYVHGGWAFGSSPDTNPVWDEAQDDAFLTWEVEGLPYLLFAHGLGLDLADMVRMAESLH